MSPIDIVCPYCGAQAGEHCTDSGTPRPEGPHLRRITTALGHQGPAQQEGTTVSKPIPSTPVAAPAVDVPILDEEIGAELADADQYNGPEQMAEHEPVVNGEASDSPTSPDLPITGTNSAEMSDEDRRKAIAETYSSVSTWLREEYRDQFIAEMQKRLAERGIEWSPKPTKAERAKIKARQTLIDAGLPVPADHQ